ncbi:hypothetical protein BaRGS_00008038 [Batillaria attramentaria]|uniref:Uncharacterized protein n=1 Tax=Batillaria attramentaria TaxID=370345 RepID=A0ABD0LMH2_9CAEN
MSSELFHGARNGHTLAPHESQGEVYSQNTIMFTQERGKSHKKHAATPLALGLHRATCFGDDKVKALAAEKKKLVEEIKRLENLLDDEQTKQKRSDTSSSVPQVNGPEMQLYEIQREASKQIHDYKFKLQKAEQDIATLEGMVGRLETQVKRYKSDAERAEGVEDELKQEKRKLQRELREAQTQVEELQNQNKHLTTRLDRIKQSRTALGIQ